MYQTLILLKNPFRTKRILSANGSYNLFLAIFFHTCNLFLLKSLKKPGILDDFLFLDNVHNCLSTMC